MKRSEIVTAISNYVNYTLTKCNGDKGKAGKALEVLTRDHISKNGISSVSDVKARSLNSVDARIGNSVRVEIKCGSGAVSYAESDGMGGYIRPFTNEDRIAENILPKADLVIWYPWGGMALQSGTPFKYGFVFSRSKFVECLECIGKNGLASSLKVSKQGGQLNIQTISAKLEDRLFTFLEGIPSVEEYFAE